MVTDLSEKTCLRSVSACAWEHATAYLEMVADQMSVFAARTLDQDSAMMVALFREAMRRACFADIASKCELVGWDLVAF